mgnify:CR=1 FL=1
MNPFSFLYQFDSWYIWETKSNLWKAWVIAINAGCRYVVDGKPACVIAQLYILEGGKVEDMADWHGKPIAYIQPPLLAKYPILFLSTVQYVFDLHPERVGDVLTRGGY